MGVLLADVLLKEALGHLRALIGLMDALDECTRVEPARTAHYAERPQHQVWKNTGGDLMVVRGELTLRHADARIHDSIGMRDRDPVEIQCRFELAMALR